MPTQIFVNLPVKDLGKSMSFFKTLGYSFNQQFTDETAACMVISETIYAMLLTRSKFKEFAPKEICDATKSTEVLIALSCDSRAHVENLIQKAFDAGGTRYTKPKDYGFMYQDSFQDLDGHVWELIYIDPQAVKQGETK